MTFITAYRKVELAVFLAVTSVDPLRVYINDGEWHLRYTHTAMYRIK